MKWMNDNGTKNLLADIAKADPFDGGCAADVTDDPAHGGRGGTMGDAAAALPVTRSDTYINRAHRCGRELGLIDAREWLRANGWREAASALFAAHDEIVSKFD